MKKRIMLFVAMLSFSLIATGCTESPEDILKETSSNMSKLDNYAMNMTMNMGMKSEGIEMEIPVGIESKVDEKNKVSFMKTSIELMGIKVSTDSYLDYRDKKVQITYTQSEDGEWEKETEEKEDSEGTSLRFEKIIEKGKNIEVKESDDKNILFYRVTIPKEKMEELLEENADATESMTEGITIKSDVIVDVYIHKSDKLIQRMYIDFTDFISSDDTDIEITKFDLDVSFNQYNEIGNVTIPEAVTKNAVEAE